MSTKTKQGERRQKKPYVKPEVKQVRLTPEEAVLGNCKLLGSTVNSVVPGNFCEVCGGALGS